MGWRGIAQSLEQNYKLYGFPMIYGYYQYALSHRDGPGFEAYFQKSGIWERWFRFTYGDENVDMALEALKEKVNDRFTILLMLRIYLSIVQDGETWSFIRTEGVYKEIAIRPDYLMTPSPKKSLRYIYDTYAEFPTIVNILRTPNKKPWT